MGTIAVGQITITDLMDGAPGQNGIAASLTSDTHVVPTDVNGNNGFYTGCSSTIELYEGGKKLTTGVAYSFAPASGITGSGNTSTGMYTVTTMSVDASYVDLKATYQGSTYVKRFTVTKAKQGSTGSQGIPGTPGSNGQSLYTWVKYADDALGNGMSDNPNGKKYIGLAYNKTTATESTNKTDYEWTLISNQTMLNNYSISGDISYGWQNAPGFSLVASDEIGYYGNLRTSGNEMQISDMMEIEPSRSYKISLTIKNPETDATNRGSWYFGIHAYDKNKNMIGVYVNKGITLDNNPYFNLQSRVNAPFDWTTYEGYVHAHNIDTAKTIPKGNCANYLRFDKKCKYIRVRFLNYRSVTNDYGDGKLGSFYYAHPTITAVDSSALTNNSEDVFNALTNNGAIQGIYMKDGQLYVNGQYINAKNLAVTNSGGVKTFYIDQSGNVSINANSLSIVAGGSGNIPTKDEVESGLDNKVSVGGTIDDINQSPEGQISYPKLNITGAISFDDLASEIGNNFIAKKDAQGNRIQTVINGRTIETGTVTADKLNAYELNITKRKFENGKWVDTTIPTFNISQEGLIQASGTFKSFDFIGDVNNLGASETGWIITDTGESVFNNSIIRGRVELPNAGITNYGKSKSNNIVKNSNFKSLDLWTPNNPGAVSLDKTKGIEEGYSLHIKTSGLTADRWSGANQTCWNSPITKGEVFTISGYYYVEDVATFDSSLIIEFKGRRPSTGVDAGIGSAAVSKTSLVAGKWVRFIKTITANEDFSYGYVFPYIVRNGEAWITNIQIIKGNSQEDWAPHTDELNSYVRFWSGASYEKRHEAPFKVLQDGTIIASRGEFGGTFTGKIEIGNIVIEDTTTSFGTIKINNNDNSKTIVQISDDKSFFNSQLNLGTEDAPHFRYTPNTKALEALEGSSIIFNTKGSKKMRINNSQFGAEVLMGDIVSVYGEGDRLNVNSAAGGKFTVSIGNFADASTADDVFVDIDGSARVRNMTIAGGKFYESIDGTGIDLFIE